MQGHQVTVGLVKIFSFLVFVLFNIVSCSDSPSDTQTAIEPEKNEPTINAVKLLQPRSLPYVLSERSGVVPVEFKVHVAGLNARKLSRIILRQKNNDNSKNQYELNDKGLNGDRRADDDIYTATLKLDTNDYIAGDCLQYEASASLEKSEILSPIYSLCITGFPTTIVASNVKPENILTVYEGSKAVADELLVRFVENADEAKIKEIVESVGAQVVGGIAPRRLYQIRFSAALSKNELMGHIKSLNAQEEVEHAYTNYVGTYAAVPNDPEFANQHGLQHIRVDDAWDTGATGSGITVTILDSGIETHTDLPIGGTDLVNHGTAVAGVVAAITDNAIGVAGVAYDSTLEAFTVSTDATVTMAEMVAGFQTVAASGTGEIVTAAFNISLAPPPVNIGGFDDQFDLCAAIDDVVLNGATPVAVVVSGAGNDNSDTWHYPSKCNDNSAAANAELTRKDLLITVGSSVSCAGLAASCADGTADTRYSTSNYGAWIDVFAPGASIRSTDNTGSYDYFTGTSFSVGHVAGVAAQLRACGVAIDQIESTLTSTALVNISMPAGGNKPRIDIYEALAASNVAPTAVLLSGSTNINENVNTTGGLTIGTLSTTDANACDFHNYSINGGADAAAFSIVSGDLVFDAGVLDFETQSSYSVTVRSTDYFGSMFDQAIVINVTDINEAPNVVPQAFNVDENAANSTSVGTVVATDVDAGDSLSYAITAGNTGNAFTINSGSGEITVQTSAAVSLANSPFSLTVEVTDSGLLTDSATITITVNDVNAAPSIAPQVFNLNENSTNGTSVGTVVATDPDVGDTLSYAITAGNTDNAFSINSGSGQITVQTSGVLDFETTPTFNLTVEVTDVGLLSDSATITINLNNVNEGPSIAPQVFNVNENAANGTSVGTVVATDVDAGDTLSYAITAGNTGNAFVINSSTGEITVQTTSMLDFETTPVFNLAIEVTDAGLLNDSAIVTINLNGLNEAPSISPQAFSIPELPANGTVLGTVIAIDPDAGDTLSYAITAGNTGNAFAINSGTGEITVQTGTAVILANSPFSLTIEVTDAGLLTDSATITVTVDNVNDAPTIAPQAFNVDEGAPNGTSVGTVIAADPDAGDTLSYAITAGNTGSAFTINSSSGEITVLTTAAITLGNSPFSLTVEVTDTGLLTDSATITITVNDVNDAPTIAPQVFNVNENEPNGTSVGTVVATDPDVGDILSYAITAGNTGNAFAINNGTGEITVQTTALLDLETTPAFNLTVEVTDTGALTDNATVTINLNNVNETPSIAPQVFNINENEPNGTSVGTVVATDVDAGDTLSYAITAGNTGNAFAINSSTGEITVQTTGMLDFETTPVFNLTVEVTDAGLLSDSAAITINLNDVAEVPGNTAPNIAPQVFNINENEPNGTSVGTVVATDPDVGDTLSYAITAGNTGNAFAINSSTGEITVQTTGALDFETTPVFNLTVEVTDTGALSASAAITINLNDVVEVPVTTPVDVVLVMDRSGSMNGASAVTGTKLQALQSAANLFIDQLSMDESHRLGLVQFNTGIIGFTPPDDFPFQVLTTGNASDAGDAVDAITAGGGTNILAGVEEGANTFVAPASSRRIVVLFTDGKHNSPSVLTDPVLQTELQTRLDAILPASPALEFYSIGFGTSISDVALTATANANDGWHVNEVDSLMMAKDFTAVAAAVMDDVTLIDPVLLVGANKTESLDVAVSKADNNLTFVVHWDNYNPKLISTSIVPPVSADAQEKCSIQNQTNGFGFKQAWGINYRVVRVKLPLRCGNELAHEGDWKVNVTGSRSIKKSERVDILAYASSDIKLDNNIKLSEDSLDIVSSFMAKGVHSLKQVQFVAYILPPLPETNDSADQDKLGSNPDSAANIPKPELVERKPIRVEIKTEADAGDLIKGRGAFKPTTKGLYQVRVIAKGIDKNGQKIRREQTGSFYYSGSQGGWGWWPVIIVILVIIGLILRSTYRKT